MSEVAHLRGPHVAAVLERFGDIVVNEASPAGEPRKGSLAAHAGG